MATYRALWYRAPQPPRALRRALVLGCLLVSGIGASPARGQSPSTSVAALLRLAGEAIDHGEFESSPTVRAADFARAVEAARRAVQLDPQSADVHFELARALGRTALALGVRERVKYAVEVRDEALKALAIAPMHAGALHVLGVWHAEVMRLNGFERAVAKTFLGGQVFGMASWPDATRCLEQAVSVEPTRLSHRLDLARIYRDTRRPTEARREYDAALSAPLQDANDGRYREQAQAERRALDRR